MTAWSQQCKQLPTITFHHSNFFVSLMLQTHFKYKHGQILHCFFGQLLSTPFMAVWLHFNLSQSCSNFVFVSLCLFASALPQNITTLYKKFSLASQFNHPVVFSSLLLSISLAHSLFQLLALLSYICSLSTPLLPTKPCPPQICFHWLVIAVLSPCPTWRFTSMEAHTQLSKHL